MDVTAEGTDSSKDFTHKQNVLRTVLGISAGSKVAGMEETLPIIEALTWSLDETSLSTQDDVTATVENLLHHVLSEIQPPNNGMEGDGGKLGEIFQCEYLDTVVSSKAFVAIKYFLSTLDRL
uniref:Uncharacterized protein n=1 Tax=Panagrolaimus sp. ES5 TaxID=591445 RepID=A0AC34GC48_9BILA